MKKMKKKILFVDLKKETIFFTKLLVFFNDNQKLLENYSDSKKIEEISNGLYIYIKYIEDLIKDENFNNDNKYINLSEENFNMITQMKKDYILFKKEYLILSISKEIILEDEQIYKDLLNYLENENISSITNKILKTLEIRISDLENKINKIEMDSWDLTVTKELFSLLAIKQRNFLKEQNEKDIF